MSSSVGRSVGETYIPYMYMEAARVKYVSCSLTFARCHMIQITGTTKKKKNTSFWIFGTVHTTPLSASLLCPPGTQVVFMLTFGIFFLFGSIFFPRFQSVHEFSTFAEVKRLFLSPEAAKRTNLWSCWRQRSGTCFKWNLERAVPSVESIRQVLHAEECD